MCSQSSGSCTPAAHCCEPKLSAYQTVPARRLALVAIDPIAQREVAIDRYDQVGEGVAEVAVAVSPEWRRAFAPRLHPGRGGYSAGCRPRTHQYFDCRIRQRRRERLVLSLARAEPWRRSEASGSRRAV